MAERTTPLEFLSPWWRNSVIFVLVLGFTVLTWIAVRSYQDAPPIPDRVASGDGTTIFTRDDILVTGAYLGPEFLNRAIPRLIEWLRMPGDLVFIALGAFPLLVATGFTYRMVRNRS
ncbi:hypothetical protein [Geobacter hydrogenophilus]|uniref:Uncharacterized protein n=1 Tax=Geobacter hydrogenophilus TaxID=40983 RepID=A0A9W6G1P3_9BACT|nr:hypothetical protein [Geobacter hydrogenophilus]GLI38797.1 hypothetical protein GHYDROH2_22980 [Geobacter hydrogenophilus]